MEEKKRPVAAIPGNLEGAVEFVSVGPGKQLLTVRLFALSVQAVKLRPQPIEIYHAAARVMAASTDEAARFARTEAEAQFPRNEGWVVDIDVLECLLTFNLAYTFGEPPSEEGR